MSVPAVVVERVPVPEWANDLILQRPDQADLLILPQRVRDGRGEYGMDDLVGVKTLRAAGVRADWAHSEPEDRTIASEYSADVAVSVVLFVGQSLAQEGVVEAARWLLARVRQALSGRPDRKTSAPVVVQVNRLTLEGTGARSKGCGSPAMMNRSSGSSRHCSREARHRSDSDHPWHYLVPGGAAQATRWPRNAWLRRPVWSNPPTGRRSSPQDRSGGRRAEVARRSSSRVRDSAFSRADGCGSRRSPAGQPGLSMVS